MADVITRFRLETNQFDSKLRDASQEMAKLSQHLQMAGNDFDKFAQKHVEAARALGQTESGATNLKDKLRDLVSAYNNVAKAYNNLTAEQQKGDFGKAMAASLDQLQSRITQTKNELYGMTDSTKKAESGMGALNSIFGASITKLAGWGAAISAAKGALYVAKDAFFASEQNLDEWGRTVESSQALYDAFLTSINTGDISGFLSRMNQISQAAREAYDAMDLLGTQKTIQSPQLSAKQTEIARMRAMLQAGRYIAPADGRSTGGMKTGDILTPEQIKNISKNLEQALNEVANITKSQVRSATSAIDKLYNEQAAILGISKQRFMEATSSWEKFQEAIRNGNEYLKFEREHTQTVVQNTPYGPVTTPVRDSAVNPYNEWAWVNTFRDSGEGFNRLVEEIQKRDAASAQLYGQYGQAYRRINRAEGINPYGGGGHANTTAATSEAEAIAAALEGLPKLTEELKQLQQAQSQALNPAEWQRLQDEIDTTQLKISAFKGGWEENMRATITGSLNYMDAYDQLKEFQDVVANTEGVTIKVNTAEAYNKAMELFSQIEDTKVSFQIVPAATDEGLSAFEQLKAEITAKMQEATVRMDQATLATILTESIRSGIDSLDPVMEEMQQKIAEGLDVPDEAWQKIIDEYNELRRKIGEDPIEIDMKTGSLASTDNKKTVSDRNSGLNSLINNVTNMTRSLQDLGIKVPEGFSDVINIMNIIQSVVSSLSSLSMLGGGGNILGNIPIIGPIFSLFGGLFHDGGMVTRAANGAIIGGNRMSADLTPVLANAGEVILSKSQQANLVTNMASGSIAGGTTNAIIESDQIKILLQNGAQAKGITLSEYLNI